MNLKILHLNFEKGRFYDSVIKFITQESFDIVHLQEVSSGILSHTNQDLFERLKQDLGYQGELGISYRKKDSYFSFFGNATFFKPSITLLKKNLIYLKDYIEIPGTEKMSAEVAPHNALHLTLKIKEEILESINTHLAWGPTPEDKDYKLNEAKILFEYMKKISGSWILSGDFNVPKTSQIVQWFDTLGRNLTTENNVSNTLNSEKHRVQELFPGGLAVDFLYTSQELQVKDFSVIEEHLSDHLGLQATITI